MKLDKLYLVKMQPKFKEMNSLCLLSFADSRIDSVFLHGHTWKKLAASKDVNGRLWP